ncbi:hypothetical protein SCUP515_03846 [Seiridium cupressi]
MSSIAAKFSHDVHELDRRERKRLQNRMAQRIYRKATIFGRNQKQRLQALEAAVANAAALSQITPSDGSEESLKQDLSIIFGDEDSQHVSDDHDPSQNQLPNPIQWIDGLDDAHNEPTKSGSHRTSRAALHRAICNGNDALIVLLLERGADIMKVDESGNTVLHLAAECASEETIQLLLLKGADPNLTNYIGRTALFIAVQTGNEAAAKALLTFPTPRVDVDCRDSTGMVALHLAVDCGLESMTRLLLDHGADVNA